MGTGYEILIADTDERFICAEGENILKAMERLNRKGIPIGCRGGGCGVCRVRVVAGRYTARKMSREHVTLEEEQIGIGLACRLCPESDLTLQVIGNMRRSVLAQIARTAS
jgi:ferredoxin